MTPGAGGGQAVDCTPGAKLCLDGDVYRCSSLGNRAELYNDCDDGTCNPRTLNCESVICTPGPLGCTGTLITECDAAGVEWKPTDVDCSSQEMACKLGECQDRVCVPNAKRCLDDGIYLCDESGSTVKA